MRRVGSEEPRNILQRILDLDVHISRPFFRLSLPLPLECLLSVPGNLMGPPLIQVVGPLWIMVLLDDRYNTQGDFVTLPLVSSAIFLTTLLLLVPWILFLRGQHRILSGYFFSNIMFGICPLLGICISSVYGRMPCPEHLHRQQHYVASLCFHFILLYNSSCSIILWLKHWTKRKRPACTFTLAVPRKHLDVIPKTLATMGPHASFPSGDVMAATALAITLLEGGVVVYYYYYYIPLSLILFACLGRMYFLAHHLLDCLGGVAVAATLHSLCALGNWTGIVLLPRLGTAKWYHPLGAFVVLAAASLFRKSNQK